jgi:hypothetical protein
MTTSKDATTWPNGETSPEEILAHAGQLEAEARAHRAHAREIRWFVQQRREQQEGGVPPSEA